MTDPEFASYLRIEERGQEAELVPKKRPELPPGWENAEDEERFDVADEAFRYSHTFVAYGSRWSRDWRWPPWTRPSFVYGEVHVPDPSITYD